MIIIVGYKNIITSRTQHYVSTGKITLGKHIYNNISLQQRTPYVYMVMGRECVVLWM